MGTLRRVPTVILLCACAGCYHATVETGATPSTQVIEKKFASSWIYGLVPPSTVSTQNAARTDRPRSRPSIASSTNWSAF
jgi:hypothetical protein